MSTFSGLTQRLVECAEMFRLGQDIQGAVVMVDVFAELEPLFQVREAVDQTSWSVLLHALLLDQQRQNWLGLADSLEYELVQLLVEGEHA